MELSVREWMMIVGVLLIVAVLLDGYRRVRNERRNRIRVSLSKAVYQQHHSADDDGEDEDARTVSFELPNGGARVIAKRSRNDLQLDEPVPMLMESVRVGEQPAARREPRQPEIPAAQPAEEPARQAYAGDDRHGDDDQPEWREDVHPEPEAPRAARAAEPEPEPDVAAVQESLWESDEPPQKPAPKPKSRQERDVKRAEPTAAELNAAPQEVLVINVISKDKGGFKGPDLLQILLACDLRFGKMNIFHRYEKANGRGQVQFSVANLVEPGTFTLDAIDSFTTPGVSFFLALPGPEAPIRAFDYMVETAQALVRNLNAELRDEAHSVITTQTLEHCRQRIRDFERKQLTLHV